MQKFRIVLVRSGSIQVGKGFDSLVLARECLNQMPLARDETAYVCKEPLAFETSGQVLPFGVEMKRWFKGGER
jgi:hypothetical protein